MELLFCSLFHRSKQGSDYTLRLVRYFVLLLHEVRIISRPKVSGYNCWYTRLRKIYCDRKKFCKFNAFGASRFERLTVGEHNMCICYLAQVVVDHVVHKKFLQFLYKRQLQEPLEKVTTVTS